MAIKGKCNKFLTLTVSEKSGPDPVARCRALIKAWRALRARIIKKFSPDGLPFLAVIEAQKNGEPHLHIMLRSPYIPQKWIAEQMDALIGAPICWIEEVQQGKKLANYVAKYCGKDPQRFGTCKRYWQSKDWRLEPKIEKSPWRIGDPVISRSDVSIEEFERAEHCYARKVFYEGHWTVSVQWQEAEWSDRPCEKDGCRYAHHGPDWGHVSLPFGPSQQPQF